jgi:hypothetical protein
MSMTKLRNLLKTLVAAVGLEMLARIEHTQLIDCTSR